jgi:hypothetical protein
MCFLNGAIISSLELIPPLYLCDLTWQIPPSTGRLFNAQVVKYRGFLLATDDLHGAAGCFAPLVQTLA